MQTAYRTTTYDYHSPYNPPQITVASGETFLAQTALCTGDWLHSLRDTWSPEKSSARNPTVVIAVAGANPGDLLAVDILEILPDSLGYTGFFSRPNILATQICAHDFGLNTRTVSIENGIIHWSDRLALRARPMIGTLGTASAHEVLSNAKAGAYGGNMDVQEVCPGTTVYLPVSVTGALLHVGDVHALQGDGEICGAGGIECRAVVKLRTRIVKRPEGLRCVRMENETHLMTVSCGRDVTESFREAAEELLTWITQDYSFGLEEAYLLMGQVLEARATQFVNPTRSYICKMPKAVLGNPIA